MTKEEAGMPDQVGHDGGGSGGDGGDGRSGEIPGQAGDDEEGSGMTEESRE